MGQQNRMDERKACQPIRTRFPPQQEEIAHIIDELAKKDYYEFKSDVKKMLLRK